MRSGATLVTTDAAAPGRIPILLTFFLVSEQRGGERGGKVSTFYAVI